MKKIIFYTLIFSLQAGAQNKNIRTPLADKSFSGTTVRIFPVQNELVVDCKNYVEFLIAGAAGLTADDVEFARTLPLWGQMKNSFEADFELGTITNVEIKKLQELTMRFQPGSLSEISTRLGLSLAPAEIFENTSGTHLKIRSRDLMCDLLSKKVDFTAMAHLILSLGERDVAFLKRFYDDINAVTAAVLTENDNTFVKAALLGLAYTEVFRKHNLPAPETKENLTFLFNTLFLAGSLEPDASWGVQTSRNLGPTPVVLKVGLK